jgi:hypothetical protein
MIGGAQNKRGWRQINIGKPFFSIAVIVSLLMGCGTLNESRKKNWHDPRIAHFSESPEINKSGELIIRTPTLGKLKVIKPQIIKAHTKEENTSETKQKENLKQIAQLIEEEKPYDRLNLIMIWIALLSSCSLVWCSIWFFWRYITK